MLQYSDRTPQDLTEDPAHDVVEGDDEEDDVRTQPRARGSNRRLPGTDTLPLTVCSLRS